MLGQKCNMLILLWFRPCTVLMLHFLTLYTEEVPVNDGDCSICVSSSIVSESEH